MQIIYDLARFVQRFEMHVRPDVAVSWKEVPRRHSELTQTIG